MPIFGAELAEVAPKDPICCVSDGDYLCTYNFNTTTSGLMPNGSFSIMYAPTEQARAFTGFPTGTNYASGRPEAWSMIGHGGYFWATNVQGQSLYRIDPATGGITTTATGNSIGNNGRARITAAGDYIVIMPGSTGTGDTVCYRVSTGVVTTYAAGNGCEGLTPWGNLIVYSQSSVLKTFNPATGAVSADGATTSGVRGRGVLEPATNNVYMKTASSLLKVNAASLTFATFSHALVPGGTYGGNTDIVFHTDGWIYGYGDSDYLIGFDPATGTFGKEALSPTRGRRSSVASCDGKLWIPSGEPLT